MILPLDYLDHLALFFKYEEQAANGCRDSARRMVILIAIIEEHYPAARIV